MNRMLSTISYTEEVLQLKINFFYRHLFPYFANCFDFIILLDKEMKSFNCIHTCKNFTYYFPYENVFLHIKSRISYINFYFDNYEKELQIILTYKMYIWFKRSNEAKPTSSNTIIGTYSRPRLKTMMGIQC